jgi:membrane protein
MLEPSDAKAMVELKYKKYSLESLSVGARHHAEKASKLPVIGTLICAAQKSRKDLSKDMSASIAYFTFLSMFPLILGLFALSGFFLKSAEVEASLNNLLIQLLPASSEFITRNIDSLIRLRGTMGIASIIVLMWSASKMVGAFSRGINKALGFKRPYAVYMSSLRNFALTLAVSLLVFVTIALAPLVDVLDELQLAWVGSRWNAVIDLVTGHLASFAISATMISAVYLLLPFKRLRWKELAPGILVSACIIELGKKFFVVYVSNVSPYDAVYGSVSSIIVLLIWLYFSAYVILYGSEVIAVYREAQEHPSITEYEERES